jgi:DNA polymerase I
MSPINGFERVWAVDFEFSSLPGSNPSPICLVAWELHTGTRMRVWEQELRKMENAAVRHRPETLFIAYYASAEMGCHLALGWPIPENLLDLYTEFRCQTNGRNVPCGSGLIGALAWHGLQGLDTVEKDDMRALALRGGPWTVRNGEACSTTANQMSRRWRGYLARWRQRLMFLALCSVGGS